MQIMFESVIWYIEVNGKSRNKDCSILTYDKWNVMNTASIRMTFTFIKFNVQDEDEGSTKLRNYNCDLIFI